MRALLFSNSTNAGEEYLSYTLPYIQSFLGEKPLKICFIPFAGVTITYDAYYQRVCQALHSLGHTMNAIHTAPDAKKQITEADCIMTGGGNTFHLVYQLQKQNLLGLIRERVMAGTPYIGWSAGSNIFCPTLSTTNDMPIIQPESFATLGLIPFQINPHYTDAHPDNHAGETRQMRIEEFLEINPQKFVLGLRESSLLHIENASVWLKGSTPCTLFAHNQSPKDFQPGTDLSFLL